MFGKSHKKAPVTVNQGGAPETVKPLASLSSGLLARKGGARPAMRPQGYGSLASLATAGDALGWNDMGAAEEVAAPVEASVQTAPIPHVLIEREALKEEIEAAVPEPVAVLDDARPVSLATATRLQRETALVTKKGSKAAFTLRLDADRHLRLRLASATRHRSAQQLVTQALDAFLESLPEVEALARQLPPVKRR